MKLKHFFPFVAALFLIVFTFETGKAQDVQVAHSPSFDGPCDACRPAVSNIFVWDFPSNCLRKGFSSQTGGMGRCTFAGMSWWVNCPQGGGYTIVGQTSQFPMITFSGPGTYEVCATVTDWWDANGNGIQESTELCTSNPFCKTVVITCD